MAHPSHSCPVAARLVVQKLNGQQVRNADLTNPQVSHRYHQETSLSCACVFLIYLLKPVILAQFAQEAAVTCATYSPIAF